MKELSSRYLSEFCMELALLVQAGIPVGEGLLIMRDDDHNPSSKELISSLIESMEQELPLSRALEASLRFPGYFLSMIRLGERSGKLDDVLRSLSTYYDRKAVFTDSIRRAILYPLMLIILMATVIVVLVTQVLPIFHDVFAQVGAQMSALAVSLMNFGSWLSSVSAILLILLIVIVLVAFIVYKLPLANKMAVTYIEKHFGDKGILKRISSSKFAMAMAMAVSSGLDPEQAITLAGDIYSSSYRMMSQVTECKKLLSEGESLESSLLKSNIFSRRDSRLLALGAKTGRTDEVMSEIARRGEEAVMDDLDDKLKKIEPTLVIVISLIVGLILFSVMLPLMGIMSSIG